VSKEAEDGHRPPTLQATPEMAARLLQGWPACRAYKGRAWQRVKKIYFETEYELRLANSGLHKNLHRCTVQKENGTGNRNWMLVTHIAHVCQMATKWQKQHKKTVFVVLDHFS
jgi:hypothetical protein